MDSKLFFELITYLGNFLIALNVFLFFKSYRNNSIAFKILSIYLVLNFSIQTYSFYLFKLGENNLFLSHYFLIGQFLILSFFFFQNISYKIAKKIIISLLIIIPILLLINGLQTKNYKYTFNIPEIVLTTVPLLFYSFTYLIQKLDVSNKQFNYFNLSFFIYNSSIILLFVAENISSEIKILLSQTNRILYLFFQIFIFIEWYENFRKKPTKIIS